MMGGAGWMMMDGRSEWMEVDGWRMMKMEVDGWRWMDGG